jgi:hypothetical protein
LPTTRFATPPSVGKWMDRHASGLLRVHSKKPSARSQRPALAALPNGAPYTRGTSGHKIITIFQWHRCSRFYSNRRATSVQICEPLRWWTLGWQSPVQGVPCPPISEWRDRRLQSALVTRILDGAVSLRGIGKETLRRGASQRLDQFPRARRAFSGLTCSPA